MYEKRHLKEVVYKFCKYFYYWFDFPEIYILHTRCKIENKTLFVLVTFFRLGLSFYIYMNIYNIYTHMYEE